MKPSIKIVRLGTSKTLKCSIFCKITFDGQRLSISGVEGPKRNGDCVGSCGQIDMHLRDKQDSINLAPGWTRESLARFFEVWQRWHLNYMTAGSPNQEQYLCEHPITDRLDHYGKACAALEAAGLNPDPNYIHDGKPYSYGHAWLSETIPVDVIEFLGSLPETDQTPAWV